MNKRTLILIISTILLTIGTLILSSIIILVLFGWLTCGKFLYIVYGANGPIPACKIIFKTEYIQPLIISILLLIIGITLLNAQIKNKRIKEKKHARRIV